MKALLWTALNYLSLPGTCTILAFLGLFVGSLSDVPWWVWPLAIVGIPFLPFTFLAIALDEPASEAELAAMYSEMFAELDALEHMGDD